jgi:hypothetical protein
MATGLFVFLLCRKLHFSRPGPNLNPPPACAYDITFYCQTSFDLLVFSLKTTSNRIPHPSSLPAYFRSYH